MSLIRYEPEEVGVVMKAWSTGGGGEQVALYVLTAENRLCVTRDYSKSSGYSPVITLMRTWVYISYKSML